MHGYAQWAAAFAVGVMIFSTSHAQAPADAPVGTTGLCKDGAYYSGQTTQGACAEHGGVKVWYGTEASAPAAPSTASGTTPSNDATPARRRKLGEGLAQVWVDPSTKVYHCGTTIHGTTRNGEYMTEFDAKAAGYHADQGKACP